MSTQPVEPGVPHFDSVEEAIAYYAHLPITADERQRQRIIDMLLD